MEGLADILVSKGGYNATDAANAANGPRAAELAKEFGLSSGGSGSGGGNSMQDYLDTYQNQLAGIFGGSVASKVAGGEAVGFEDIKSELTPEGGYPEAINRVESFQAYRDVYGVDQLEKTMNNLRAQQDELVAQTRINVNAERGKQVATNVIEGRVTEQQRTAQENLDFIQRQMSRANDQLTTAYKVIDMYMNFENLDYQDAVTRYNTEFQKNLDTINLMRGVASDARDVVRLGMEGEKLQMDKIRLDSDLKQRDIDNARANLQIYTNAITNGNMDMNNLSAEQKTQLNKLEVQSGLPVGFIGNLQLNYKDRIAFTSTNNGVTQVGIIGADGNISVKNYGTSTGTATGKEKTAISAMQQKLLTISGSDNKISPTDWQKERLIWQQAGYNVDTFDKSFGTQFVNWNHATDYGFLQEDKAKLGMQFDSVLGP